MPKGFIIFLAIAQAILSFLHLVIFWLLLFFFPSLSTHSGTLLTVLMLLSISFLAFSIITHNRHNRLLVYGYIFSSVFLLVGFYFTLAAVAALVIYNFVSPNFLNALGYMAVIATLLTSVYGTINARIVRIINLHVTLPNLPEFWKGKTAVMVSDLHLGQVLWQGFAKKVVQLINQQNPEIVFIPGDFYDGVHTDFAGLANEFKNVKAPLGIYFCSGNHEMFAGYKQCEDALKAAGIKILEDQKVEVEGLQIAGLAYKSETDETVKNRIENLQINPTRSSIMLKHVPDHLLPIAQAGISLQLSGHSHQGQTWPFRYITKRIFKGFDYGLKQLNNLQVYTSSGVGTWGPPVRVFTKSEIVKITFT